MSGKKRLDTERILRPKLQHIPGDVGIGCDDDIFAVLTRGRCRPVVTAVQDHLAIQNGKPAAGQQPLETDLKIPRTRGHDNPKREEEKKKKKKKKNRRGTARRGTYL
jgi:hypothetical protein